MSRSRKAQNIPWLIVVFGAYPLFWNICRILGKVETIPSSSYFKFTTTLLFIRAISIIKLTKRNLNKNILYLISTSYDSLICTRIIIMIKKQSNLRDFSHLFRDFLLQGEMTECTPINHLPGEQTFLAKINGEYYVCLNLQLTPQNSANRLKELTLLKYLSGYEGFVAFKGVQINALPTGAIYLCLLYEYLTNTVDQAFEEMMSRKLSTNQIKLHFWKALLCAIKCLGMLEKANVYHGNINYSHLQLRLAELTPPKLFFNPSQPTSIQLFRIVNEYRELFFLSPEEIETLNGKKFSFDYTKSDLFNIGTLFLSLLSIKNSLFQISRIYTEKEIDRKLELVQKFYGFEVGRILRKILSIDPRERPEIYELEVQIRNIIDILEDQMKQSETLVHSLKHFLNLQEQNKKTCMVTPEKRNKKIFQRQSYSKRTVHYEEHKRSENTPQYVNRSRRKVREQEVCYDNCLTTYCVFKLF